MAMKSLSSEALSRRGFLRGSAAVAAGALLAPSVLSRSPASAATRITGATVNPSAYGISGWIKAANIFDSYVGEGPLAQTIQKVYLTEGSYPSNPFPADMTQLTKVGCQFIVCVFPSRTTDESVQLATYLQQLTSAGFKYRVALDNEWNTGGKFTPQSYQAYWAQYAPVVKAAGVPLCLMVCASSSATAYNKIQPGFPASPLPDQYWIDYYGEAYSYKVRLDTPGGLLDQADSLGVPAGIGESGYAVANSTHMTMTIFNQYCGYLAGLASRLQLGGLYWGSANSNIVTSATDPKVPGIQQYMRALQTG
jgi:hypothetical protein